MSLDLFGSVDTHALCRIASQEADEERTSVGADFIGEP